MSMDYLSPQSHIDEDKVNEVLIRPLERFLCGATLTTTDSISRTGGQPEDPAQILRQVCLGTINSTINHLKAKKTGYTNKYRP